MTHKERVIDLLKSNPGGLTIEELKEKLKITRQTIAIIIAELKGSKQIIVRKVGPAKLCYWDFEKDRRHK